MTSDALSKIISSVFPRLSAQSDPQNSSNSASYASSPYEPRLKLFVLESVCAPCVQNMGQWANPNAMNQPNGSYQQPCPSDGGTTPPNQNSPRNALPSRNGTGLNWQQQAVNDTVDRAIRYSTYESPRGMNNTNNLPVGNGGRR